MGLLDYIVKRAEWPDAGAISRLASTTPPHIAPLARQAVVQLIGDVDHVDFRDAIRLLRTSARVAQNVDVQPELILIAQSRPGAIRAKDVERLRQRAPLAGMVALLGSWCEGESRTGRPWPGVSRLYWYEFPAWFQRQLALRAASRCPDWARGDTRWPLSDRGPACVSSVDPQHRAPRGVIELQVSRRDSADALTDVLQSVGYATVWHRAGQYGPYIRGAVAGIWDGGQLDETEANQLAAFCHRLNRFHTPVIASLDFPRRDRVELAKEIGAAAVLGKPLLNDDLLTTIDQIRRTDARSDKKTNNRAA